MTIMTSMTSARYRAQAQLVHRYELCEESYWYDTVEAEDIDAALEIARDNVDAGNYPDREGTIWVTVGAREIGEARYHSDTVQVDPDEPTCAKGVGHDWQSPYDVVGGVEENPGVRGHGGGVIITEACANCGRYRVTDTWAQNPANGTQGLTSVSYRDADENSRAWINGDEDDDEDA